MKKKYQKYLEKDHSFDKVTMLGIFCFIIVITGMFGFLYEFMFFDDLFFNLSTSKKYLESLFN